MTRIWTIGHSTRTIEEFIEALQRHGIKLVADVRLLPGSKRYPQFNKEELANSLIDCGVNYEHFPELGGRRRPKKNSRNTAWRNEAFRGYADHMETAEFVSGIARLREIAEGNGATAIMCAEVVWWKCHRSLIADYLKAQGAEVIHIINANKTEPHPFTSAAKFVDGKLDYSGAEQELPIQFSALLLGQLRPRMGCESAFAILSTGLLCKIINGCAKTGISLLAPHGMRELLAGRMIKSRGVQNEVTLRSRSAEQSWLSFCRRALPGRISLHRRGYSKRRAKCHDSATKW